MGGRRGPEPGAAVHGEELRLRRGDAGGCCHRLHRGCPPRTGPRTAPRRAILALVVAAPWLAAVVAVNNVEGRAAFSFAWLPLVDRMLFKTGMIDTLWALIGRLADTTAGAWLVWLLATLIFLIGGLGTRCVGLATVWSAALGGERMRQWTPLAWIAVLGLVIPFGLNVQPFPNSIQAYQLALFALWPFTVYALWPNGARASALRWAATAALVAASVPATIHYARVVRAASDGKPLVALDAGDLAIISTFAAPIRSRRCCCTATHSGRPCTPSNRSGTSCSPGRRTSPVTETPKWRRSTRKSTRSSDRRRWSAPTTSTCCDGSA